MKPFQIKKQIRQLANEFDLEYNSRWFNYLWITKKEEILTEYILGCPDPVYNKYGFSVSERTKNLHKFVKSKIFKSLLKRYGGSVISNKESNKIKSLTDSLKNIKEKQELLNLAKRIENRTNKGLYIALLTRTNNKKEYEFILKTILLHEWIHILLNKNYINFNRINKKYWKYDEGLVTYLENYLSKQLHTLKSKKSSCKTSFGRAYYSYGIRFRKLLNNKSPKERKQAILNLYKNLS